MKILMADDSKFMRTILKTILQKIWPDAEFFEGGTGVEAIALNAQHDPDLILLDLVMPEKGGIDVLKEIGTQKKGKIVVISALGQDNIITEAKQLGAASFIVKPFDEKDVVAKVQAVVGA